MYKTRLTFVLLSIIWIHCTGQENLIPNPSFEEYYDCDFDLINTPIEEIIPNWYTRLGRPRYFNENCIVENFPHTPREGTAFLSLITLTSLEDEENQSLRDYSIVELQNSLIAGRDYYLEYYGALTFMVPSSHSHHGIRFTNEFINETDFLEQRQNPPLIRNDALVVDSLSFTQQGVWERHQHCFIPDSSFRYMVLGNFTHRDSLFHEPFDNIGSVGTFTSYDNFFLAEIELEVRLDEYEDNICAGDCITLSTNHSLIDGVFEWQLPGSDLLRSTDSTVTVCYANPGVYDVRLDVQHCTGDYSGDFQDAVTVVDAIDFSPLLDTILCPGEDIVFVVPDDYDMQWSDGNTNNERIIDTPGTYEYTVFNGSCDESFTFDLQFKDDPVIFMEELFACQGEEIIFKGQTISEPGTQADTLIDNNGCDSLYMITMFDFYEDIPIEISGQLGLCPENVAEVEITSLHEEIIWSDGSLDRERSFDKVGSFTVAGLDPNGCLVHSNVDITSLPNVTVNTVDMLDIDFEVNIPIEVSYEGDIATYSWIGNNEALSCYDCPFPILVCPKAGIYTVEVANVQGCIDIAQLRISFNRTEVYVPNAIHPSSKVLENQVFYAQSNNALVYELQIFNRWGGLVYKADQLTSNDPSQGWQANKVIKPDVFVYVIKYLDENENEVLLKGNLSVF